MVCTVVVPVYLLYYSIPPLSLSSLYSTVDPLPLSLSALGLSLRSSLLLLPARLFSLHFEVSVRRVLHAKNKCLLAQTSKLKFV